MMKTETHSTTLSPADFFGLGLEDIAFVKPVTIEGRHLYSIHAADGTPLTVVSELDIAFATIRQHEMEPVSVH